MIRHFVIRQFTVGQTSISGNANFVTAYNTAEAIKNSQMMVMIKFLVN
jgi:hypothetical protein